MTRNVRLAAAGALVLLAACGGDDGGAPPDAQVDAADTADAGPRRLSETGLYSDLDTKTIAGDLIPYTPAFVLWSDGASKRRWVRLPPGETIDTSDMDHWMFPVGTQFFKEFSRDGVLLETRLVEHVADTGDDDVDYWMGAFLWLDDESDAVFVEDGADDVHGTDHDVPSAVKCRTCHGGEPGHALSFSAVQLSKGAAPAPTLSTLAADGRLSDPPPAGEEYPPPGDATTQAALGYLHANCGHCHNPHGSARPDVDLFLRLDVAARLPEETAAYTTAVGVPLQYFHHDPLSFRIVAGDSAASAVIFRMSARGDRDQMPPIATEHVDDTGVTTVAAWIDSL